MSQVVTPLDQHLFQSSLPVAGERVGTYAASYFCDGTFQSSLPVAGERVRAVNQFDVAIAVFQSSLPVAGERVSFPFDITDVTEMVSILAPRCRGARPPPLEPDSL